MIENHPVVERIGLCAHSSNFKMSSKMWRNVLWLKPGWQR